MKNISFIKIKSIQLWLGIGGLWLLGTLASCQPEPLPITLPQKESQLVIFSQIFPGEAMLIGVTRSFGALTRTDTGNASGVFNSMVVERARVVLNYNGQSDTLQKLAPGFYGGIAAPSSPGTQFYLEVYDSATGQSVSSVTTYTPQASFDSLTFETKVRPFDTLTTMTMVFDDLPGSQYYMINAFKGNSIVLQNPNVNSLFQGAGNEVTEPLADATFSQTRQRISVNLPGIRKGDTCVVSLTTITKEYYTYLVQRQRSSRNGLGTVLGEPVNYTTNIQRGLGFFTAHIPFFRIVRID